MPKLTLGEGTAEEGERPQLHEVNGAVSPLRALAQRAQLRRGVELAVDGLRFQFDYMTAPRYQPLPWRETQQHSAARAEGVHSRWEAMLPVIQELEPRTAVDIGCNIGWFTVNLASLGVSTLGIESFPPYYRTAIYGLKRRPVPGAAISVMELNEQTARLLPHVDCSLLLAIWHHFVQQYGISVATTILGEIWARTGKVLFFESGEKEMSPAFGLPKIEPDARTWFTEYLGRHCQGGTIRHLGLHHAGHSGGRVAWRNLFAVVREETA